MNPAHGAGQAVPEPRPRARARPAPLASSGLPGSAARWGDASQRRDKPPARRAENGRCPTAYWLRQMHSITSSRWSSSNRLCRCGTAFGVGERVSPEGGNGLCPKTALTANRLRRRNRLRRPSRIGLPFLICARAEHAFPARPPAIRVERAREGSHPAQCQRAMIGS